MLALWIVLAVVVATVVVGLVVAVPRRRRGRGRSDRGSGPGTTTSGTAPLGSTATIDAPVDTAPVEVELAPVAAPPEEPEPDIGPAPDLRERMGKTRGLFSGYVRSLRTRSSVDDEAWEDLEEALLRADVGVATTTALLEDLRSRVRDGELRGADAVVAALREDLRRSLDTTAGTGLSHESEGTCVWLFVGVNGVGKTTTIGKVARREKAAGHSVLLAAGDTFRAAAAEQLDLWAQRTGVEIVRGAEGGDPSAVVFDAVQRADARGKDLVLADTAGRLHTKVNLVEELKKIRRVADRPPGHVNEVLLVLDATTGQNGLTQARQFLDAVGVTGVVLTKLDGSAKGGIVIAIQRELGLPVKLVGIGEGPDDLVPFDADEFVAALFD
ncbi:MAG TPA: signal recognition particle-docking protein FtsY [Acidimicrobiales bacterium]|nr:signal recognition particle-docking protein FtsY [Acidimicrobiales bacterium]